MTSQTPATQAVIDIKNNSWEHNAKARTYTRTTARRTLVITQLSGSSYPYVLEIFAGEHRIDSLDFETFDAATIYANIAGK